jgi:L-alanine-DL-glutamate epimerase-like enolase superfamily enzyme
LSKTLKTPIILDESFLCIEHFQHIEDDPEYWIINLRISKMGGILRSLAIIDKAKELKIPIVVGAQVGETSILTRAALAVANNCREILLAQEGAFGTHLLKYDITDEPISFGEKGKIIAPFRSESKGGFGLNIESERTLSTYSSPG